MPQQETFANTSPISRSNLTSYDERSQGTLNNVGSGITATLTRNIFNRSFPDWVEEAKIFSTFYWAPLKVIGQGIKNIQWGTKETETFIEYKVGDLIQLKIKGRPKVYESRIGDLKIKLQCSLDFPPHWHVDKFLDVGEYEEFIDLYQQTLAQSMSKTMYELLRFMFISACYYTCLPTDEYNKLLLRTLITTADSVNPAEVQRLGFSEAPIHSPLYSFIINHRDHFKAVSDEINKKISNTYVFDCYDIVHSPSGSRFNPFKPFNTTEPDNINKLRRCLVETTEANGPEGVLLPSGQSMPAGKGPRLSREQCLKAFEIVLATIGREVERPNYKWWQGYCGNINKSSEGNWNDENWPIPSERYEANKGTTIMDKPMSKRPMLEVVCKRENKVLIMSRLDYEDFTSGIYKGYFGSQSTAEINFEGNVRPLYSEIMPIDGLPAGFALVVDKRMICIFNHLESSGIDTIAQRLVSVATTHKWLVLGLFDQFVGVKIQMTSYTANPLLMQELFFSDKAVKLMAR